jgi:hypothetical protein
VDGWREESEIYVAAKELEDGFVRIDTQSSIGEKTNRAKGKEDLRLKDEGKQILKSLRVHPPGWGRGVAQPEFGRPGIGSWFDIVQSRQAVM